MGREISVWDWYEDDDVHQDERTTMSAPMRAFMWGGIIGGILWLIIIYGLYFGVPFIYDLVLGSLGLQ